MPIVRWPTPTGPKKRDAYEFNRDEVTKALAQTLGQSEPVPVPISTPFVPRFDKSAS